MWFIILFIDYIVMCEIKDFDFDGDMIIDELIVELEIISGV